MVGLEAVEEQAELAERGDDLDDTGDLGASQRVGQSEDLEVEREIGLVAEFHREVAVAERTVDRLIVDHALALCRPSDVGACQASAATPSSSSTVRIVLAISTEFGPSPWTQIVSAESGIALPDCASTTPSAR